MPPENVIYPPTRRARNYVKNTLPKCYNPPPKHSEVFEDRAKKNGFRRYYPSDSGKYRGWWKNNKKHGLGTEINIAEEAEVYEGYFKDDKRSGYGVLSRLKSNGLQELRFQGDFANGAPNGKGDLRTDTYNYMGRVVDGKASGVGIAWYKDGKIYYGTWFKGKRMGQGMLVLKNKNRYEGNWCNDKKHGYGQYCFFDRGQALEGIWVADVCITGVIRNIKYRQAATDPVKCAIPKLMLKDWTSCYYIWEKEAFAVVGKYVREDLGFGDDPNEGLKKGSLKEPSTAPESYDSKHERDDLALQIDHPQPSLFSKHRAITEFQPCVIFRYLIQQLINIDQDFYKIIKKGKS